MKKSVLNFTVFFAVVFTACSTEESKEQQKENTDSLTVQQDSTMAEVERYFTWEKISEADYKKVDAPYDTPPSDVENEEDFYKSHFNGRVSRKDSLTLQIHTEKGDFYLKDQRDDMLDEYLVHVFFGIQGDLALVKKYYYEGMGFEFYDLNTGDHHDCYGYPVLSPDAKLLMASGADLTAMYSFNGLVLFKREKEKWVKAWELELSHWEPYGLRWENSNTIVLKRSWPSHLENMPEPDYLRLKLK